MSVGDFERCGDDANKRQADRGTYQSRKEYNVRVVSKIVNLYEKNNF